jgi:hypothetical protein
MGAGPALGAISSESRDYSPRVTADGRWLCFTSERSAFPSNRTAALTVDEIDRAAGGCFNGLGNIYRVPVDRLRELADSTAR